MISKEMTIDDILTKYPSKAQRLAQVLTGAGLSCVGCGAATWETLEQGVLGHGFSEEALQDIQDQLNAVLAEKEADPDTITITPRAAAKYQGLLEAEGKGSWGIRFEEQKGGCSGTKYALNYSEKAREGDRTFTSSGIEIHVPEEMISRLLGSEIDYVDGLQGSGFKISNPNVRRSCGCGSSHSY